MEEGGSVPCLDGGGGGGGGGVAALIAQRERELAQLRADSLLSLQQQLQEGEARRRALEAQLATLRADFDYNLALLEGRDLELATCERALAAAGMELAVERDRVAQMQQAVAEAETGAGSTSERPHDVPSLSDEHTARTAAEQQLVQQRRALMNEARQAREAALRRQRQQGLERERRLKAELDARVAQATQAAAQQLQAAHEADLQRLAEVHVVREREWRLRSEVAEQLAHRREVEAQAANERLRAQTAEQAAVDATAAAHAAEVLAARQDRGALQQQLAAAQAEHACDLDEQRHMAAALRNALEDQRADGAEALRRCREEMSGAVAAARQEGAAARQQAQQLAAELEDARAALEVQHTLLQEQLERICGEREREAEAAREALRALHEQHNALQDFVERQQEALATAQNELSSSASACERLQLQVDAAERRAVVLSAGQGPSLAEVEAMLQRLTAQRDAAQQEAAKAQAQLSLQEVEVRQLQQRLQQQHQQQGGSRKDAVSAEPSCLFSWPIDLSAEEQLLQVEGGEGERAGGQLAGPGDEAASSLRQQLEAERRRAQQLQAALHVLTEDMQRLQLQRGGPGPSPVLADVTNIQRQRAVGEQPQQSHQVQRLCKQVNRAQTRLRLLSAENERLMELSNCLRAERNRLAQGQQQHGADNASNALGFTGSSCVGQSAGPHQPALPAPASSGGPRLRATQTEDQLRIASSSHSSGSTAGEIGGKPGEVVQAPSSGGPSEQAQQESLAAPLETSQSKLAVVGIQLREEPRNAAGAASVERSAVGSCGGSRRRLQQQQQQRHQGEAGKSQQGACRVRNYSLASPSDQSP